MNIESTLDIAISGLRAAGKQMEAIGSNVANAQTTDSGDGTPYRRIQAILESQGDGISGVEVKELAQDMSEFQRILGSPGDPRTSDDGYIYMPNVNMFRELVNMNMASRAYQANAAMMKRYQKMVETSLELLRG